MESMYGDGRTDTAEHGGEGGSILNSSGIGRGSSADDGGRHGSA